MRIFFDINLEGGSISPRDLAKFFEVVEQHLTQDHGWIVAGVDDYGVLETPTLEQLELRREEAPEGTPPNFLQDFTTTCEPD